MLMYNEPDSEKLTMIFAIIRRSLIWIGLMLSISILVFLIIWGVSLNVSENAEIPVVKAKIKEARIISENPGGQIINYQGLSVNNVQEQGAAQVTAKRILLAPKPVELKEKDLAITEIKKNDNLVFISAMAPVKNFQMLIQNLEMCKNVFQVIKNKKIDYLLYVSSDAVYSDSKKPLTENSITKPESMHSLMHINREIMLKNSLVLTIRSKSFGVQK